MSADRDGIGNAPSGAGGGDGEQDRNVSTLDEILAHKAREVAALKQRRPLRELEAEILQAEPPRNLFAAVTRPGDDRTAVIAEIKRRSPSAGLMRAEYAGEAFDPVAVARAYHGAGARAISCLTDERFFGGSLDSIKRIKEAVPLPVLRKDFIIDEIQLYESRAAGADAVLLIAEALTESRLVDLLILSQQLRMTVLLEVHSMDALLRVRPHVGFPHPTYCLLGINNRNLATMTTDVAHTLRMVDLVEDTSVLVSESGITEPGDLERLREAGVRIVLVGEHLMKHERPGEALQALLEQR